MLIPSDIIRIRYGVGGHQTDRVTTPSSSSAMPGSRGRRLPSGRKLAVLAATLLITINCCVPVLSAETPVPPKHVLVLLPVEGPTPAYIGILNGLETGLRNSYPTRVSLSVEFIRATPPVGEDYPEHLYQWLSYKYGNQHFDAICPMRPEGMELAEKLRDRLWPSIPIVFGMLKNEYRPEYGPRRGVTGTVQDFGEEDSVRAALQLLPETRHVALVGGSAPIDRALHQVTAALIHRTAPSVDIIPIIGLTVAETADRLSRLPDRSIIYLGSFSYDAAGHNITTAELAHAFSQKADAPLFNSFTAAFGSGSVGGPMTSMERGGEQLGRQLARVLSGTPPESIPILSNPHVQEADWRELKKWASRKPVFRPERLSVSEG